MTSDQADNQRQAIVSFSWKRIGKTVGVIVAAAAILGGVYFFVNARPVKIVWASWLRDRRETFTDCESLPFYQQVQKSLAQHGDALAKIKAISGVNDFYPEQVKCFSPLANTYFIKGQLVLTYSGRQSRQQAENLIGKDFFGIPYRGEPTQ